ncbi:MAG: ABC transporter permease [Clostridiales bacterium]|nr:ABC transporter permease [Clostridiales bacterium]
MYAKLAVKNVRRQIGNYMIYFITITLTVALMFSINNVLYSESLSVFAETVKDMRGGLIALFYFIALIVAFVLGYATSFMLKLRKREFGTYLTLGMKRKNILSIFIIETMVMAVTALGAGIALGLFIYQGMIALVCYLMEMPFTFGSYSLDGLKITILLVAIIFVLASITSALYLSKVSIYQLIHGKEQRLFKVRAPWLWLALTVFSAVTMGVCFVFFYREMERWATTVDRNSGFIILLVVIFAAAVLLFYMGLSKALIFFLMKCPKLRSRLTNTFILRQLSSELGANAVMTGILAVLIGLAVVGANISFTLKTMTETTIDRYVPFDVVGCMAPGKDAAYDFEAARDIIDDYADITDTFSYNIYTDGESEITRQIGVTVVFQEYVEMVGQMDEWSGPTDSFMRLSDFNRFARALGREELPDDGHFYVVSDTTFDITLDGVTLERNGVQADFGGFIGNFPRTAFVYYVVIVPDVMTEGMDVELMYQNFSLANNDFDALALKNALSYERPVQWEDETYEMTCDYEIKAYTRMEENSVAAIVIVGAMYTAVVFVFMAMAILALKILAGIGNDRRRYDMLRCLGARKGLLRKTLFWQIFIFFFFPFTLPLLFDIPVASMCEKMTAISGFSELSGTLYINGAGIAFLLLVLYTLYFTATYKIARRNILTE